MVTEPVRVAAIHARSIAVVEVRLTAAVVASVAVPPSTR
jgi:hypothetical protein